MSLHLLAFLITILMIWTISRPLTNTQSPSFHLDTKTSVMSAFFISLIPLSIFIYQGQTSSSSDFKWLDLEIYGFSTSLQLDKYSIMFIPIALLVTWSILEFSIWYMQTDPNINQFFKYLLIFLLAMITLVCAGNLFILFIGWEGVGIMSFLLIGWYHTRSDAATAALQAVLYNRAGDIGFLFAFCWLMKNTQSIHLLAVLSTPPTTILLTGFITAAASKSAQFGLHPWLASAMEGPTPVSALLHSSTMVVAGIFLLIRIHPLLSQNSTALTMCLCLGAISTLYAATCALVQNDIKKIIAYSTSSQLGLMMVAIGLNSPYLAFFHICTHAFFKAMLFLCSGLIIHSINDEQDIRKMGRTSIRTPNNFNMPLHRIFRPYGYAFPRWLLLQGCHHWSSKYITWLTLALLFTLVATAFTAIYSMRLIYFASMSSPRTKSTILFDENDPHILNSLTRLTIGSILAGLLIFYVTFPDHPIVLTMPTHMKLTALSVTMIAFYVAHDLASTSWTAYPSKYTISKKFNPLFFNQIVHRTSSDVVLNSAGQILGHLLDSLLLKKFGPDHVKHTQLQPTKVVQMSQTGLIKTYLSVLFITMTTVILF
uniref:NADH-ubiquinone oxidoreductase chain 5 n=1 Tax=Glandirana rugosa TaxID=8410 RepID=A0A7G1HGU5_GLARU|nr:NADH dehydrogenase subunit 5 [Glandirana rugosa]